MFKRLEFHQEIYTHSNLYEPIIMNNLDSGWYLIRFYGEIPYTCPKKPSMLQKNYTETNWIIYLPGYFIIEKANNKDVVVTLFKLNNLENKISYDMFER